MAAHARLGPSDSARWLSCPGSIEFTKNYPDMPTEAADEGTAAHWVREHCLSLGFSPYDFIGTEIHVNGKTYTCDAEMADALAPGINEVREFDGEMYVEHKLDLGRWMPGQFGTLDCGIIGRELIVLSDLKYGTGVPVQAVGNTQQMIYALGFWDKIAQHVSKAKTFLIIIDQPRNNAGGGYWSVTLDELLAFGEELRVKAAKTYETGAPLRPSAYGCKWCPAANLPGRPGGCPAHHQENLELVQFDDLDAPEPWTPPVVENMTFERLVHLTDHMTAIKQWLDFCHARVLDELLANGPKGNKKAVYGRASPRKWIDEKVAAAYALQKGVDPYNKKIKTPPQIEALLGKKFEIPQALVERGKPKPVIVPVEDKRDAIKPITFDDLGEESDI